MQRLSSSPSAESPTSSLIVRVLTHPLKRAGWGTAVLLFAVACGGGDQGSSSEEDPVGDGDGDTIGDGDDSSGVGGSDADPDSLQTIQSGSFSGTATVEGTEVSEEGGFLVDDAGSFTLLLSGGSLSGTAVLQSDGSYVLTVDSSDGLFASLEESSVTGTYAVGNGALELALGNGDIVVGGIVLSQGETCDPDVVRTAVWFTHNECDTAEVTILGDTLGPISTHYHQGGLCDSVYDSWRDLGVTVPGVQSKLFCHDVPLRDIDTGAVTVHELCESAAFMLAPNTEYTYTVEWADGSTGSGSFTSGATCKNTPVCLSKEGAPVDCALFNSPNVVTGKKGNPHYEIDDCGVDFGVGRDPTIESAGCYEGCIAPCNSPPPACDQRLCPNTTCRADVIEDLKNIAIGECLQQCTGTVAYLDEVLKRPLKAEQYMDNFSEFAALLDEIGTPEDYPSVVVSALADRRYCAFADRIDGPNCAFSEPPTPYVTEYWQCTLDATR